MRNPLILWSLYLIPIFSESEHIEHRANSSHKSVFIGARGMNESDIARHVVMGWTYRLRAGIDRNISPGVRLSNWVQKKFSCTIFINNFSFRNHILLFWEVLPTSDLPSLVYCLVKNVRAFWRRFEIVRADMCWLVWGRAFKCGRRLQRYKFLTHFADIQFTRRKNGVTNVLVVLRISEKLFEYLTEVTRVEWNAPRLFPSASLETIYFNSRNKARIFNSFPSLYHFKICQPQNICSGQWLLLTQNLIFQMHRPSNYQWVWNSKQHQGLIPR